MQKVNAAIFPNLNHASLPLNNTNLVIKAQPGYIFYMYKSQTVAHQIGGNRKH